MSRYIDADAMIDRLDYCVKEGMGSTIAFTFKHMVEDAPSIDIVRCKECKHCLVGVATAQYSNGKQRIENLCEKHKWSVRADDFCSYGEREGE